MENKDLEYKVKAEEVVEKAERKKLIKSYEEFLETPDAEKYAVAEEEEVYYRQFNTNYDIGDIVYVSNYKYKDEKNGKNHFFVIISKSEAIELSYFGFLISSKISKANYKYNQLLNKNELNRLAKNSIVKCDDLIRIQHDNVKFKIGCVDSVELNQFLKLYHKYLS